MLPLDLHQLSLGRFWNPRMSNKIQWKTEEEFEEKTKGTYVPLTEKKGFSFALPIEFISANQD
ncbi:MAG: hypothetical protein D6734_00220 [Candidatus Schekmanbacteria bacterium]|nr:MAG: hypothetical protein D6734_00220 [Candidatus Schekmanbacteria bacterium]